MIKSLFVCEKPSQAKDIARVLGVVSKREGYIECKGVTVTWCLGHLLETAMPEYYCDNIKPWRIEKLPIIPDKWHMIPVAKVKKQLSVVKKLIKDTNHIVIATDADREGELIAREMMSYCKYTGSCERLWLSALDDASIRKALNSIRPGKTTENLYYAGLARQRADWIIGMNMTMATSSLFGKYGDGVLSVGRVQTPTLQLIVARDRAIEEFKAQDYYELYANFIDNQGQQLWLKWVLPKIIKEQGHCLDKEYIAGVANKIHNKPAIISSFKKQEKKQPPPLPFSLSTLQKKASSLYGYSAKKTLSLAQELYEKYKATTYPRTDSGYLPLSQFSEAAQILASLSESDSCLVDIVKECDLNYKSPAWNDKKVTAHHGIIPTTKKVNVSSMPQDVLNLYRLIRTVYIAQFLGNYIYKNSRIITVCENEEFSATGKIPLRLGWKKLLSKNLWGHESKGKDETVQDLPDWNEGQSLCELQEKIATKQTKPPSSYTEGTLIGAMESIGKYVEEPKLKKILKETSGIGTQATRANIIELLIKREYVIRNKKQLISSEKGRALIDILPTVAKDPATTAVWEQDLEEVASGSFSLEQFIKNQKTNLSTMLDALKASDSSKIISKQPPKSQSIKPKCTSCGNSMSRKKSPGKKRYFWGCEGYPECKITLPDFNGKPGYQKSASKLTNKKCTKCNEGYLAERKGKYGKFYGCSNYPKCKNIMKNIDATTLVEGVSG